VGLTTPPCKTWICFDTSTEALEKRSEGRRLGRPWPKNGMKRHRRRRRRRRRRRCMYMHNKCIVKIISQSSTTDYHIIFNYNDRAYFEL
jgi:hypothetical protein